MSQCNLDNDKIFIDLLKIGLFKVSSDGSIFNNRTERFLGLKPNSRGYGTVCYKYKGKIRTIQAHRLIWISLNGPITDPKAIVNHEDGDKMHNHPSNHVLTDAKGNSRHAREHNLIAKEKSMGSKNHQSKLNEGKVEIIKLKHYRGYTTSSLAKQFNISSANISLIVNNKAWKHVTFNPNKKFKFVFAFS